MLRISQQDNPCPCVGTVWADPDNPIYHIEINVINSPQHALCLGGERAPALPPASSAALLTSPNEYGDPRPCLGTVWAETDNPVYHIEINVINSPQHALCLGGDRAPALPPASSAALPAARARCQHGVVERYEDLGQLGQDEPASG